MAARMPQVAEYVKKHNLSEVLEDIANDVIRDLPENPMQALQSVVRCAPSVVACVLKFRINTLFAVHGWLAWEALRTFVQLFTRLPPPQPRWVSLSR